jgi:hypothetical protein
VALFQLYRLNTNAHDDAYWKNVVVLSQLERTSLLERFGVPRQLWLMSDLQQQQQQQQQQHASPVHCNPPSGVGSPTGSMTSPPSALTSPSFGEKVRAGHVVLDPLLDDGGGHVVVHRPESPLAATATSGTATATATATTATAVAAVEEGYCLAIDTIKTIVHVHGW